jgi:hypothetical protein
MVNQGLLFSKLSIVETGLRCAPSESIELAECEICIGALSPEDFNRLKKNYTES